MTSVETALAYMFYVTWSVISSGQDTRANTYRKNLWSDVYGKVIELGPGFGASFDHLPHKTASDGQFVINSDVIQSYMAVEPNPFMFEKLQANAEGHGFSVNYDLQTCMDNNNQGTVTDNSDSVPFTISRGTFDDPESIPQTVWDNAPYDTVVTSFSLCTASNPKESIRNIVQLLKPGGTYIFIEHILHPPPGDPLVVDGGHINGAFWSRMQKLVSPVWNFFGHGCHITRETDKSIVDTPGWDSVEYKYARVGGDVLSYFVPMAFGKAIKSCQ
ncbi:hypothetical protein GGH96_000753 [Coemansia sp. RSA 1972]|nr:hypothetical protein GGH96_000753 [Coemansia sp. RSA 1972]